MTGLLIREPNGLTESDAPFPGPLAYMVQSVLQLSVSSFGGFSCRHYRYVVREGCHIVTAFWNSPFRNIYKTMARRQLSGNPATIDKKTRE